MKLDDSHIEYYIPMVHKLSKKYISRCHYHCSADEIISAGYYGLVKAVRESETKMYDDNADSYIGAAIKFGIRNFLNDNHLVKTRDFSVRYSEYDDRPTQDDTDIEQVMDELKLTGDNRIMARTLYMGYNMPEIAQMLGVSKQAIHLRVNKLRDLLPKEISLRILGLNYDDTKLVRLLGTGSKVAEIAQCLGVSKRTVRKRIIRIRQWLSISANNAPRNTCDNPSCYSSKQEKAILKTENDASAT